MAALTTDRSPAAQYLARLDGQAAAVRAILDGRTPEDLERRPAARAWNGREQIAHLARYHEVFLERIGRILSESAPRFSRYRAEDDPGFAPFLELSAGEVLGRFDERRRQLAERVAGLSAPDLARIGVHPAFGEMSLALWLEFFLAHEGHHLYVLLQRVRDRAAAAS